jgi:hypothetical protein
MADDLTETETVYLRNMSGSGGGGGYIDLFPNAGE